VYTINKGINKSIEFKGLKAQYIWYLGGVLMALLVVFAILYIMGVNAFLCLGLIGAAGGSAFAWVYRLSNTHGEHGMMKKIAAKRVPDTIKVQSRQNYIRWNKN
jgi:hypothetical protein